MPTRRAVQLMPRSLERIKRTSNRRSADIERANQLRLGGKPTAGGESWEPARQTRGEGGRQRGFFVSFGYTKDAHDECAAFYKRTKRIIKLLTVQEILDEEHVQKM